MSRIRIAKTLKLYVGGKFIRSESGRVDPMTARDGSTMQAPRTSRKDLREAMQVARAAAGKWSKLTAYNRGQILYRLGEMLDDRAGALPTTEADAFAAADRAVHHAGWTDKLGAVLSTINPVASGHVNYARLTGMGVFAALPRAEDGLLGMVEATCAALVASNSVILCVPTAMAELAVAYAEALATSDVPAGVVNVMIGDPAEMLDTLDRLDDLDGILISDGAVSDDRLTATQAAASRTIRRVVRAGPAAEPATAFQLGKLAEVQTVWISQ